MRERHPLPVRWTLTLAGWLVPAHRRASWRRQWDADVAHRVRMASPGRPVGLFRFALGSVAHALHLRREDLAMRGLLSDLRLSARGILRRPGAAAVAMLTFAAGIGAATAVFSLAEAVLLRTLPLEHGDRLVHIYSSNPSRGMGAFSVSYPDFRDLSARSDLLESASFSDPVELDLSGVGDPERLAVEAVHEGYFETLGVDPFAGRVFDSDDHRARSEATVVLAEGLWVRRFGADPSAVGRTVRLDGVPHTVIGVVAARQAWPPDADAWIPLQWDGAPPAYADARSNHTWQMVARLREGVSIPEASEGLRELARSIYAGAAIDPRDRGTEALAVPLRSSAAGDRARPILLVLSVAVSLVLLIACINASGLLLTRAWVRARELSLRAALGAGRARLGALILTESVLLAALGGAAGLALAHVVLRRIVVVAAPQLPTLFDVRLNGTVVAGAVGISLLASVLAGLVPALRAARTTVAGALREGGGAASASRSGVRLRRSLVVAQLALSLALLVAAGLTIRGLQRQLGTDPGFDAESLLTFSVRLPESRYDEPALVDSYFEEAVRRLVAAPGVSAAATTSLLPLGGGGMNLYRSFIFDGATPPPEGTAHSAAWVEVGPTYFETLGVRPAEGRPFTRDDEGGAALVALVNRTLARQMAPGEQIVGRSIRSHYDENLPRRVVGVMPDVQFDGFAGREEPLVLVPRAQSRRRSMALLLRMSGDPSG